MEQFVNYISQLATTVGLKLLYAIIVLVVGLKLSSVLIKFVTKSKGFAKIDSSAASFLTSLMSIVLRVVVIISAAAILGIPMTSFVTILASAGVAIGLALQGSLSNFAGGIMILLFKPFKVGDVIEAGAFSGVVKSISVFSTTLSSVDSSCVIVPNGSLTSTTIKNYTVTGIRRLDFKFSVAYGTDIDEVKKILSDAANANELVLKDQPIFARMTAEGDSSLDFALRVWVKPDDYGTVMIDLLETIHKELCSRNIEIPFPQMDVHVRPQD